jgi:phospholipid/cholesterol/gamma-HCH transport system permease protein
VKTAGALRTSFFRFCEEVGRAIFLLGSTAAWAVRPPFDGQSLLQQMVRMGVTSLPIVVLTAAFTGMVLGLQTYVGFGRFRAESYVATLVALSMLRELGPVLSALMVTGRVGSAIAAEIGSMRVTEQLDALLAMGVEPVQYLFVPRLLAAITMMPLLVAVADLVGIGGGRAIAVVLLEANPNVYDQRTFAYLAVNDLTSGLVKAAVFGLLFSLIACQRGYQTTGGAEGVGRSTTAAVVAGNLSVIVADFFLTKIFF